MRICLTSVEIFAWGKYGGFGKATRTIGRELVLRGHEVFAVVPQRGSQRPIESLDGITVFSYRPGDLAGARRLLERADADLYHSCEPSITTLLAQRARPDRRHVVTCRDPRDLQDWWTEFRLPSRSRVRVLANWAWENGPFVRRGVQRADAVFAAAPCLIDRARRVYRLKTPPTFLPTPVAIPEAPRKAERPTVCFLGRLDRRKRPERFLDLASRFPEVRFLAVGASNDRRWDQALRDRYASVPNLEMVGFVDPFTTGDHGRILEESWVLVNTSAREGLPNSMLEAAAHGCAIVSSVDPDGFATRFGAHVGDDDFAAGLRRVLEGDRWRALGAEGARHVADTFATPIAMEAHEAAYERLLAGAAMPAPSPSSSDAAAGPQAGRRCGS